jgi:N4-gp56 family major capsid protein
MAQTIVGLNSAMAVKIYSGNLAVDIGRKGYFTNKFMGSGEVPTKPIWRLTDLEADSGEQISYDLSMQLKAAPTQGDNIIEGKEEALNFYTDVVYIDQLRHGVDCGGRMTRKRTLHDLRKIGKARQTDYWARLFDETFFMYLSGSRGTNTEFIEPTTFSGYANNSFTAPDSQHLVYGGNAVSAASMATTDKMNLQAIDKCVAYAEMMGGGTQGIPQIQAAEVEGEKRYLTIMDPYQAYDLRNGSDTNGWAEIQKALATALGNKSAFITGAIGIHNDVVMHKHQNCIRFTNYGAGANVAATRALFLGVQAATIAFGSPGKDLRFGWREEEKDAGNKIAIYTNTIVGIKKVTFNGLDFGGMAIDTAAKRP